MRRKGTCEDARALGRGDLKDNRDLVVVHSSDLHLGPDREHEDPQPLAQVIRVAHDVGADLLLLAGDVFDKNSVTSTLLNKVVQLLRDADLPVVILPGNHDYLTLDSVYLREEFTSLTNLLVIGTSSLEEFVFFPELDLEIWGRPHMDYRNFSPLRETPQRTMRWQIIAAHGHWVTGPHDLHRSWLIYDEEITATGADYIALGHWDRFVSAGDGTIPAYYSGSPGHAKSVNVVRFSQDGTVNVERVPV